MEIRKDESMDEDDPVCVGFPRLGMLQRSCFARERGMEMGRGKSTKLVHRQMCFIPFSPFSLSLLLYILPPLL